MGKLFTMETEEREVFAGLLSKYERKGIRKKRFRKTKTWKVTNRLLYGLMFAEDIKVADLAQFVGVTPRSVSAWIYNGVIPKYERIQLVSQFLNAPRHIVFNEFDIERTKKKNDGVSEKS